MKNLINKILDATVVFSFDRIGFNRHCKEPLPRREFSGKHAIITGATSGIGLATVKALADEKMNCLLIGRNFEQVKKLTNFSSFKCLSLDMTRLKNVYDFASTNVNTPIDVLIHNAGNMPDKLHISEEGYEEMFATQVLAPFIMTKTLADRGLLADHSRVIFVSSGGMYLQKFDLSDLLFKKNSYNKYQGYANAKRAQVMLAQLFSKDYSHYLFSAMHPGWADTPGVQISMPLFAKVIGKRLRSPEQGADTILWLAESRDYPSGKFWFDRAIVEDTIFGLNKPSEEDYKLLWNYCESVLENIKNG